jgi:acetolactate synthase I/II/III large subunit
VNIQDLQTISREKIKVLILLVNNNGYLAIRHTQKEFLKSKFYGTHPDWKLTMPSFEKVTKSFGLNYIKLKNKNDLIKNLTKIKNFKGPTVCELITDENQDSLFKQGYKSNNDGTFTPQPLSEMYPFLDKYIANTNN